MRSKPWGFASIFICCSIVVGIGTVPARTANAADDCLAAPKQSTPPGKHWYYRIERPSKRQCWYLGDEGRKVSQSSDSQSPASKISNERAAAPPVQPQSSPPAKTVTALKREPMQPAVANARAELFNDRPAPLTAIPPVAALSNSTALPRDTPAPAPTPALEASESPASRDSRFAQRWPDAQTSNRVAQLETPAPSPTAPAQTTRIQQTSPQQAAVPASPATRGTSTADDDMDGLRIVLGILTAAIALAAIIGRMILTHMRPRKRAAPRRPIWQTIDDDMSVPVHSRTSETSIRARAEADVEQLLHALRYPEQQPLTSRVAPADRGRRRTDRSGVRA